MNQDKLQKLACKTGAYTTEDSLGQPIVIFDMAELRQFAFLLLEEVESLFDQPYQEYFGSDIPDKIRQLKKEA
jgi:hypothetical protein